MNQETGAKIRVYGVKVNAKDKVNHTVGYLMLAISCCVYVHINIILAVPDDLF